ncbi:glutathione S-transferase family protein [Ruegeria pomeroyi DSS-3]|uniref:Glutathione S-transferase family protein n=1 Tax=Ruegeria pomeroyi (strain ATCC 700808 / DSM 15171 / DSS-3) TaxID=246200 RepID=Q5LNJ6_RUEPO|nr:glutathione S-transferase family protein [Ruegeria pomeroyi]AAV96443.1 glutathione S-transferase family protein [Ruegeria pomeroyi DSS-3]
MTPNRPALTGYRYSVYTRAARLALIEKAVAYDYHEHDPFAPGAQGAHPFGRVPVLHHTGARFYETAAITAYVDLAFPGPALMPERPAAVARAVQVISIVDAYAYWPLVRQVYSHAVFRPAMGEPASQQSLREGMERAPAVLAALDEIAAEGLVLSGPVTRADCHLAPMIAAFVQAPEGADLLRRYPALAAWWQDMAGRDSLHLTETPLP